MMNKKLKLWKRAAAFVLSFMLLLPSIALAKGADSLDNASETEVVQIDLNAGFEKALQEDNALEDKVADGTENSFSENADNMPDNNNLGADEEISDINVTGAEEIMPGEDAVPVEEDAQKNADFQAEISPRGVSMPVTELYIAQVKGKVGGIDREEIIKNCGQNIHIASDASAVTENAYDRDKLTISVQYVGTHFVWQKLTASGDVHMTSSAPYNNVIDGSGASTQFVIDYILTPRDQDVKQTVFDFAYIPYYANGVDTYNEQYHRTLTVNWGESSGTGEAPEDPSVTFDKSNPDQYTVVDVDNTMEYRMEGTTEWTECPNDGIKVDIPYSAATTLYVRYKGDSNQSKAVTIPPRPAAPPAYTYDKMDETLSPLPTPDVEYLLGDATEYSDFTETMMQDGVLSEMIESIPENYWNRLRIRYKATDTQPASQDFAEIKLGARVEMKPVTFDPITCVFTTSTDVLFMDFKIIAGDKETAWKSFSRGTFSIDPYIFDDRDNTVLVRTESGPSLLSHSLPVTFFVPRRAEDCQNISIDFLNEQLVGFETGKNYQYRVGTQTPWKDVTLKNGVYPISGFLRETEVEFYIREKGTSTVPASAGKLITFPARSEAPTGIVVKYNVAGYEDKPCAIGVNDNQQYSTDSGKTWKDCAGGIAPLTDSVTAYFRNKPTATTVASLNNVIKVLARGAAPAVSYTQSTERLTLVKPTMEYSIGSEYMPVTGDYVDLSSYIDGLTANGYVWVRYQGNEDKPSSKTKRFYVYKRAATPTTVTFDAATSTLSGVTSKMQYKVGENGTWTNISSSNPIDLSSRASATENLNVYVRVKYVNNSSAASKSVVFVLPKK